MYECWCWTEYGWVHGQDYGTIYNGKYTVFRPYLDWSYNGYPDKFIVEYEEQLWYGKNIPEHWALEPKNKWRI
jgi:hypothetical protein